MSNSTPKRFNIAVHLRGRQGQYKHYMLGICATDSLKAVTQTMITTIQNRPNGVKSCDFLQPMIRWRAPIGLDPEWAFAVRNVVLDRSTELLYNAVFDSDVEDDNDNGNDNEEAK